MYTPVIVSKTEIFRGPQPFVKFDINGAVWNVQFGSKVDSIFSAVYHFLGGAWFPNFKIILAIDLLSEYTVINKNYPSEQISGDFNGFANRFLKKTLS